MMTTLLTNGEILFNIIGSSIILSIFVLILTPLKHRWKTGFDYDVVEGAFIGLFVGAGVAAVVGVRLPVILGETEVAEIRDGTIFGMLGGVAIGSGFGIGRIGTDWALSQRNFGAVIGIFVGFIVSLIIKFVEWPIDDRILGALVGTIAGAFLGTIMAKVGWPVDEKINQKIAGAIIGGTFGIISTSQNMANSPQHEIIITIGAFIGASLGTLFVMVVDLIPETSIIAQVYRTVFGKKAGTRLIIVSAAIMGAIFFGLIGLSLGSGVITIVTSVMGAIIGMMIGTLVSLGVR